MSRMKITMYLFVIIVQSYCVELDKTDDNMTYGSSVYDDNKGYQLTTTGEGGEGFDIKTVRCEYKGLITFKTQIAAIHRLDLITLSSISDVTKTKKRGLYSKNYSVFDAIPAVRTDVIVQLRKQRFKHSLNAFGSYDMNPPEEAWPAITFKISSSTYCTIPTPPSSTTRTFRDHFQSFRTNFRPTLTANLEFLSNKGSEAVSSTRDISAVSKFWKNFFTTAEPADYAVYGITRSNFLEFLSNKHSKAVSSTRDISAVSRFWKHFFTTTEPAHYAVYGITPSNSLDFLSRKGSQAHSSTRDISAVSKIWENFFTTTEPADYAVYGIAPSNLYVFGLTNNPVILTRTSVSNTTLSQAKKTSSSSDGETDLDDTYEDDVKRYYERNDDSGKEKFIEPLEPVKNEINTTTTTTRSTRFYPHLKWICYECGRNETKYGSPFCYDVFNNPNGNMNYKKSSLRYRCIGHLSMAYKCFKRYVDVGYYNERGCRDWPPRTSGKTYASKRLRALERMLKDTDNGCVFTPQAYLLAFSRSVQLYVRFHVCVCKGTLCNGASTISEWRLLLIILSIIIVII